MAISSRKGSGDAVATVQRTVQRKPNAHVTVKVTHTNMLERSKQNIVKDGPMRSYVRSLFGAFV